MSEPKSIYDEGGIMGLPGKGTSVDYLVKWDNPSTAFKTLFINNEPLTTAQLHELITSQSMTIDRLLGEVGEYRAEKNQMCEWKLQNVDGRKMYKSPETCEYSATHPEFRHCPSCGKRIKYIEKP